MKKRISFLLMMVLLLLSLPLQTTAESEGSIPTFPALAYGDVIINNQPAQTGIEVVAKVDGNVVGRIVVEEAGKYGGPGTGSKLLIDGAGLSGKTVEFFLKGKQGKITLDTEKVTDEQYWGAGEVKKIDLNLTISAPNPPASGGGGGTGGGSVIPKPEPEESVTVEGIEPDQVNVDLQDGDKKATITFNGESSLNTKKNQVLTMKIAQDVEELAVQVDLAILKELDNNHNTLSLETNRASYSLPVKKMDIEGIIKEFGKNANPKEVKINIKIVEPTNQEVQFLEQTASKNKVNIVVKPIAFNIEANYKNESIEVKDFKGYVQRMIAIPEEIDEKKISTAVVISEDGRITHVPTKMVQKDGKYYAVIKSRTNSFYTLISNQKEFKDVKKHWSEEYVNTMASKMIIYGFDENRFEPTKNITRAEFTAIMSRALALGSDLEDNPFSDVPSGAWYYESVLTSYQNGLIDGYRDGSFHPGENITREQAMKIIADAMNLAEVDTTMDEQTARKQTSKFKDNQSIADWALPSVAVNTKYGIVDGFKDGNLKPKNKITRAEAAKMIYSMLKSAELI